VTQATVDELAVGIAMKTSKKKVALAVAKWLQKKRSIV